MAYIKQFIWDRKANICFFLLVECVFKLTKIKTLEEMHKSIIKLNDVSHDFNFQRKIKSM